MHATTRSFHLHTFWKSSLKPFPCQPLEIWILSPLKLKPLSWMTTNAKPKGPFLCTLLLGLSTYLVGGTISTVDQLLDKFFPFHTSKIPLAVLTSYLSDYPPKSFAAFSYCTLNADIPWGSVLVLSLNYTLIGFSSSNRNFYFSDGNSKCPPLAFNTVGLQTIPWAFLPIPQVPQTLQVWIRALSSPPLHLWSKFLSMKRRCLDSKLSFLLLHVQSFTNLVACEHYNQH